MLRPLLLLIMFSALSLSACESPWEDVGEGPDYSDGSGVLTDRVRLRAVERKGRYTLTITSTVGGNRLLLVEVIDADQKPHLVMRRYLKGGTLKLEWEGSSGRYGRLVQACVAVHESGGSRKTTAFDCDRF